jgi:recombination protein RecA
MEKVEKEKEKKERKEISQDKLKALQSTLDKIEKDFGKGSIMKMGDKAVADVASISSG